MGLLSEIWNKLVGERMTYEEKKLYKEAYDAEYKIKMADGIKAKAKRDADRKAEKRWRED